ncbi:hypothetical protein TYRP_023628 [Tyrophagus putrescentiae]|nr:hypothetical protein TYRP_023628 [Tyrophagus putrescentiae]
MKILVKLNKLSNGSPWRHLAHQERLPPRPSLAPLASPSSAGVLGWPSDARPRPAHPDVAWPLSTPSSSGLARCARETLVTSPPWAVQCCPRNNCAPPAAQGESGGSDSSENGIESAKLYPTQLLR